MVQIANNTFYNREQEREAKAQERETRKEMRQAQMLAALQRSSMTNLVLEGQGTRQRPNLRHAGHWARMSKP